MTCARGVNPGGFGVATQILGGGSWEVAGEGSQRGRGRVMNYYYILSCTGSVFESGDF